MLIYLGVLFILPDKIRKTILSNGLLCAMIITGFLAGLYGIILYSSNTEGFYIDLGIGDQFSRLNKCPTIGCATKPSCCNLEGGDTRYCLVNEKRLPNSNIDQTISFNIYGRYVRIYPPATGGDGYVLLSQVVVNNTAGTNIALTKTATATGTYPQATRNPSSVIDGNLTHRKWPNIWHSGSNNRATDYWQVDLGSREMITTVRVLVEDGVNAQNAGRTTGIRIVILDTLAAENELTTEKTLETNEVDQTVHFNTSGRYVKIYAAETEGDGYINISQVVVNNTTGTNIALNSAVTATSTYANAKPATSLIDGNLTPGSWPNMWHNNSTNRATDYVQIDLGSVQMVSTIRIIGRSDSSPDRMTGLRIRLTRMIPNVAYPNGICTGTPTPVYPPGTITDDEKNVIAPMILEGLNGQTALNIYRGISSRPSTFTAYGLTDSQSAAAAVEIRRSNLARDRTRKEIGDDNYYSQMNSLRQITTMSGINSFNVSDELNKYMNANIINKSRNYTDTSGNKRVERIPDGGKENVTKMIMNALRPKVEDPSAPLSQATVPDLNLDLPAPPNTGTWAQDAAKYMTQATPTIGIPESGPTVITADMGSKEREDRVKANNPRMIVITPNMTAQEKIAAINQANNAQNTPTSSVEPSVSERDAITAATLGGKGFSSPSTSAASGGQRQWYMRKVSVSNAEASGKCTEYNSRLATRQEIQDAQAKGASYTTHGWYSGSTTKVAYPKSTGLEEIIAGTGRYEVNCYGPKPPIGTPDVAPWTDYAQKFPAGPTYVVGDWSKRVGGDGGNAKSTDTLSPERNETVLNPGTPLKTQEVYYVGGTESFTDKDQARTLCSNLGGKLATWEQFQAAKTPLPGAVAGANWCGRGYLENQDPQIAGTGCPGTNVTGVNCFGIKPSMDLSGTAETVIHPDKSVVTFRIAVVPFNTVSGKPSWSQTGQDSTVECRPGQEVRECNIGGVTKEICLNPGDSCSQGCQDPQTVDGKIKCKGSSVPIDCTGGMKSENCGSVSRPSYRCLRPEDTCSSVEQQYGPDGARVIVVPDDADKDKFIAIAKFWEKNPSKICRFYQNSDGTCTRGGGRFNTPAWSYVYSYTAPNENLGDPEIVILPIGYTEKTEICQVTYGVESEWLGPGVRDNCKPACVWGGQPIRQKVVRGFETPGEQKQFEYDRDPEEYRKNPWCSYAENKYAPGNHPSCKASRDFIFTCPKNRPTFKASANRNGPFQEVQLYKRVRYIRVTVSPQSDGYMNLSQVIVYNQDRVNVALNASVYVTSYYDASTPKDHLTDGATTIRSWQDGKIWHNGSNRKVSATQELMHDYCQIDLGSEHYVVAVRLLGRGDCCNNRMRGLIVSSYTLTDGPSKPYAGTAETAAWNALLAQRDAKLAGANSMQEAVQMLYKAGQYKTALEMQNNAWNMRFEAEAMPSTFIQ